MEESPQSLPSQQKESKEALKAKPAKPAKPTNVAFAEAKKSLNSFNIAPDKLRIIGIDTEHKSASEHPLWDRRIHIPLRETLVKSILAVGVKVPIIVDKDDDGQPVVVAGRQRVRCAREAQARLLAEGSNFVIEVPIIYSKPVNSNDSPLLMVTENEHRLEDEILGKAEKAAMLHTRGASHEDLMIAFGVSESTIKNFIALGLADNAIKHALRNKTIKVATAYSMAKRPTKQEQREALDEYVNKPEPTPREESLARLRKAYMSALNQGINLGDIDQATESTLKEYEAQKAKEEAKRKRKEEELL